MCPQFKRSLTQHLKIFVSHQKPELQDAPIDHKTKLDLERLLEDNKDAFAEDEMQIGTTPLIKMSIDTGNNPPVAKRSYTLALKHHDWVKADIDKLLKDGVIRERVTLVGQLPLLLYQREMVVKGYV